MSNFKQLLRAGQFTEQQKTRAKTFIDSLEVAENFEYIIEVKPYLVSKTAEQRGYYYGVIIPHFMEFQGCTKNEADVCLKEELLTPKVVEVLGKVYEIRPSIAKMNIRDMSSYIDSCINFLGSWGVNVPPPTYKDQYVPEDII